MFLRSKHLPKAAVCYADSSVSRAAADWLAKLRICQSVAVLSDDPKDILWLCTREKPDLLLLQAIPDTMERLDDPDKDITGRCELAVRVKEQLPGCRVCLICDERFWYLEPAMRKAVETQLIDGYHFGELTKAVMDKWLKGLGRSK